MQASERSDEEFISFISVGNRVKADFLYVADSFGSLTAERTRTITNLFKDCSTLPFGWHAHDNKGAALENTIAALESGAQMLDCTVSGMGRGAGNTQTESLLIELQSRGVLNLAPGAISGLNEFIQRHLQPLREEHGWGPSLPYRLAAEWGIHPTFVQELIQDKVFGSGLITALENLRSKEANRFDRDLMGGRASDELPTATFFASKELLTSPGDNLVIVGGGPQVASHLREISRFVERTNSTVFLMNLTSLGKFKGSRTFRLAAHKEKLESSSEIFWGRSEPKITPFAQQTGIRADSKDSVFPILLDGEGSGFGIEPELLRVPNNLTISFALGVAAFLGAKQIFLAGVDGYEDGDVRNAEIERTLQSFSRECPNIQISSLTNTKFPVEVISPYWRGSF